MLHIKVIMLSFSIKLNKNIKYKISKEINYINY